MRFNQRNLDTLDELTSPDFVEHQDCGPAHAAGAAGVWAVVTSLQRAFTDFHLAIDDLVVDGDTVWLRMTATGVNDGSFMGHPAAGRPFEIQVFDVIRLANGLMVEHWGGSGSPRCSSPARTHPATGERGCLTPDEFQAFRRS